MYDEKFKYINLDGEACEELCKKIDHLAESFDEIVPNGRVNMIKNVTLYINVKRLYDDFSRGVYTEIGEAAREIILDKTSSKSHKLARLDELSRYFNAKVISDNIDVYTKNLTDVYNGIISKCSTQLSIDSIDKFLNDHNLRKNVSDYVDMRKQANDQKSHIRALEAEKNSLLKSANLTDELLFDLNRIIDNSSNDVYQDITKYQQLSQQYRDIKRNPESVNRLRSEINDLRKFYNTDVANYVQNRILQNIERVKSSKNALGRLARIARGLGKSKKAFKTFDNLKSDPDNFDVMTDVLPIWMMGMDDVNRIIPMQPDCFDYVIVDEASQCNMAYALPVMYRAKHTIFFGDTLQMRDTNTLFKSNEQLESIAKKYDIPDDYQIKASEDSVKSVMDIAKLGGFKTVSLRYHYRSPKPLIGFSNENFYAKVGRSLEVVNSNIVKYKDTDRIMLNHVVDVDMSIETSDTTNFAELAKIKELIESIRNDPKLHDKSIAVLTFFNDQAELLLGELRDYDNVKVSTIEGIQGDERDIVIYSFVVKRSNDPSSANTPDSNKVSAAKKRYLPLTGEGGAIRAEVAKGRVNVAFSRAREQVHCVTSIPVAEWPEGIWIKKYLEYVEENGSVAYQHEFNQQQFDSKFERDIYEYLASILPANQYLIQTQVKSCGFRIDQVVTDMNTGKKLAIECDGPTHFENGDGQVYVKDDYERQFALEAAGWKFYRIPYSDYVADREKTESEIKRYITAYFAGAPRLGHTSIVDTLGIREDMHMPQMRELPQYQNKVRDYVASSVSTGRPIASASAATTVNHAFSVGDRGIDQTKFEIYLENHVGGHIRVKYQTMRTGSARYFRDINLVGYDKIYFYGNENGTNVKYRRDRVVDFE